MGPGSELKSARPPTTAQPWSLSTRLEVKHSRNSREDLEVGEGQEPEACTGPPRVWHQHKSWTHWRMGEQAGLGCRAVGAVLRGQSRLAWNCDHSSQEARADHWRDTRSASSSQTRGEEARVGEGLRGVQVESQKKSHQGWAVRTEEERHDLGKVADRVSVLSTHTPGPSPQNAHQA